MKNFMRFAALLLASLMVLSFAACTGDDEGASNGGNNDNTQNTENSENNDNTQNDGGNTDGGNDNGGSLPEEDDADNDNRIPVTDLIPQ